MDTTDSRPEINKDNEWAKFVEDNDLQQTAPIPRNVPVSQAQVRAIRRANAGRPINS